MIHSILRVPTDDAAVRQARAQELRDYIEQRLAQKYGEQHPGFLRNVTVTRRSDYDEVKVFLTEPPLIEEAKEFLREVEEELASEGIPTFIYVRPWTSPAYNGE